jgi:hypothetical protein
MKARNIIVTGLALAALTSGSAQAAVLYNIVSFNNDGTTSSTINWIAGKTTITTAAGFTGTDDAGLRTNAIAGGLQPDVNGETRFENSDTNTATTGTVITDPGASGYFSFSLAADTGTFNLTSLTFETRAGTGNNNVGRGYSVTYAINGSGTYTSAGSALVINGRNSGLFDSANLSLTGVGITSVDFRISSTTGGVEYRNFAINGEAVPEPSITLLSSIGILALLRRRRS